MDGTSSTVQGTAGYEWTGGSTANNISATASGTYYLTVTDDANGCKDITSIVITADSLAPTAAITSGGVTELTCAISSITLDAGSSIVQGTADYQWTDGSTADTLVVTAANTYSVTVTDSDNGCSASSILAITIDAGVPIADISSTTTELTCAVTGITLDASGSTVVGTPDYLWTDGSTNVSLNVTTPDTYGLTVTDLDNGCVNIASIVITENIAVPTANAGADDTLNCLNATLVLDGTGSSTGAGIEYLWSGTSVVSGATTATPTINQPGTYTLLVTDTGNDCFSSDNVLITIDTVTPVADAGTAKLLTCAITEVTLTGTGSSTGADIGYLWTGSSVKSGGTSATPVVDAPGTYTLVVTNTRNKCTASDMVDVAEIITTPVADAGEDTSICEGNMVLLTATGGVDYAWSTSETTPSIVVSPVVTTVYTVTVTDGNGCTDTDAVTVTVNAITIANAGNDVQTALCDDASAIDLTSLLSGATSGGTFAEAVASGGLSGSMFDAAMVSTGNYAVWYIVNGTAACELDDTATISIEVTPLPLTSLGVTGAYICEGNTPDVSIANSEANVTYLLVFNGDTIGQGMGNGSDIHIPVNEQVLNTDTNNIAIIALSADGCSIQLNNNAIIMVADVPQNSISGNTGVCPSGSAEYEVETNAADYTVGWEVEGGETTDSGSVIIVNWLETGSGKVKSTITDLSTGCSSESEINITIADDEKPVVECNELIEIEAELSKGDFVASIVDTSYDVLAQDNCGEVYITNDFNNLHTLKGEELKEGQVINWTITDQSGNTETCVSEIIVNIDAEITVPTAFTPDGNGINDVWVIDKLSEMYPNCVVKVFNRQGEIVFESEKGYPVYWDGTREGRKLPTDSYHYIILINKNGKMMRGVVTIIR